MRELSLGCRGASGDGSLVQREVMLTARLYGITLCCVVPLGSCSCSPGQNKQKVWDVHDGAAGHLELC